MEQNDLRPARDRYQPSDVQLARREELRRFNRLAVYWPIGLAFFLASSLVIAMVVYIILAPSLDFLVTFSAIADITLMATSCLLFLVIGLFITLLVGGYYQTKKQGMAPIYGVQVLFWRIERLSLRIYGKVAQIAPKIAAPFIAVAGRVAFIRTYFIGITKLFQRG